MDLSLRIIINEKGETIDLDLGKSTSIGRGSMNRVQIQQNYISQRHALITQTVEGDFVVDDCGSKNGTFVNDSPVEGPTNIAEGDILRFGLAACKVVAVNAPDRGDEFESAPSNNHRLVITGSRTADIYNRTFPLPYSVRREDKKRQKNGKKTYLADKMKQKNPSGLKLYDSAV